MKKRINKVLLTVLFIVFIISCEENKETKYTFKPLTGDEKLSWEILFPNENDARGLIKIYKLEETQAIEKIVELQYIKDVSKVIKVNNSKLLFLELYKDLWIINGYKGTVVKFFEYKKSYALTNDGKYICYRG